MSLDKTAVLAAMAKCEQFKNWSILEHGTDCANRLVELITQKEFG